MLLLSLGPEAIVRLLQTGEGRGFAGPDLSWLLFGPDGEALNHLVDAALSPENFHGQNFHQSLQAAE